MAEKHFALMHGPITRSVSTELKTKSERYKKEILFTDRCDISVTEIERQNEDEPILNQNVLNRYSLQKTQSFRSICPIARSTLCGAINHQTPVYQNLAMN
jgi:hypothetical protein